MLRPPHTDAAPALLFLLIEVIEPVQQLAQSVSGNEGSLLHPVFKPLRHGHHPLPVSRRRYPEVTAHAVRAPAGRGTPLVSILRGRDARNLRPLLGDPPSVESAHPSLMSADRGFFGSRPFNRADDLRVRQGGQPVDRRLP